MDIVLHRGAHQGLYTVSGTPLAVCRMPRGWRVLDLENRAGQWMDRNQLSGQYFARLAELRDYLKVCLDMEPLPTPPRRVKILPDTERSLLAAADDGRVWQVQVRRRGLWAAAELNSSKFPVIGARSLAQLHNTLENRT